MIMVQNRIYLFTQFSQPTENSIVIPAIIFVMCQLRGNYTLFTDIFKAGNFYPLLKEMLIHTLHCV